MHLSNQIKNGQACVAIGKPTLAWGMAKEFEVVAFGKSSKVLTMGEFLVLLYMDHSLIARLLVL